MVILYVILVRSESVLTLRPGVSICVTTSQVTFESCVRWMSLEFDGRCGTAQSDDSLQLYIPTSTHLPTPSPPPRGPAGDAAGAGVDSEAVPAWCPVLSKFHGVDGWPTSAVILPGV